MPGAFDLSLRILPFTLWVGLSFVRSSDTPFLSFSSPFPFPFHFPFPFLFLSFSFSFSFSSSSVIHVSLSTSAAVRARSCCALLTLPVLSVALALPLCRCCNCHCNRFLCCFFSCRSWGSARISSERSTALGRRFRSSRWGALTPQGRELARS